MKLIIDKIEEQIQTGIYPGASLAIYNQGVWQEYYKGLADPEMSTSVHAGLVYDLASVSKVVGVGTIVTFLVARGELDIDQSLHYYYPAFQNPQVSIRQLLTHTSGLDPFIKNRNQLSAEELKQALHRLNVLEDRSFRYTDVNFLLLGFMLENLYGQSLAEIFHQEIFEPWKMEETSFGPVDGAVPTVRGVPAGQVHDPKAKVLGIHAGSAGLFSTIKDLENFLDHYLEDYFSDLLLQNYSLEKGKARSLAWNLEGNWLDHTGYTGTFIMWNPSSQQAVIFLSNRTYEKDERAQWILDRNELMERIKEQLS